MEVKTKCRSSWHFACFQVFDYGARRYHGQKAATVCHQKIELRFALPVPIITVSMLREGANKSREAEG